MSLPDILVLNRFLDDYLEIRETTWNSTTETLLNAGTQIKDAGRQVLSKISASLPTFFSSSSSSSSTQTKEEETAESQTNKKIKTNICHSFKTLFSEVKTIKDWIKIILDLGEQARKAQQRSKSSLLGQTLHAIRTYIIHHIHNEAEFTAYILELRQKKEGLDQQIAQKQLKSRWVKNLIIERDTALYELADLGDDLAIFEAARFGLFNTLQFPLEETCHELSHTSELAPEPEINIYKPWYYQRNHFIRYHEDNIKPLRMESFGDFEQRALKKGKLIVKALDTSDSSYSDASQAKKAIQLSINTEASPMQAAMKPTQTPPPIVVSADQPTPKLTLVSTASSSSSSPPQPLDSASHANKNSLKDEKSDVNASPKNMQQLLPASSSPLTSATVFSTGNSKKKNKKGKQTVDSQNQAISFNP